MTTTTALLLMACAWCGSLLGLRAGVPGPVLALQTALALSALLAAAVWGRRVGGRAAGRSETSHHAGSFHRLVVLAALAVTAVAMTGAAVRSDVTHGGPLRRLVDRPLAVEARLVPVSDVRDPPQGSPWVLARLVDVTPVGGVAVTTRERVVVRLGDAADLTFGATHAVTGLAEAIRPPSLGYFATLGASVELRVVEVEMVRPPPAWQGATTWLRERVAAAAHARLAPAPASLLTGLVTGDLRGRPEDVGDDFTAAGLSHLVAVSGSNVAVVVGGILGVALLSGLGRRAGWWAALVVVWWFVILVRAEPSVVRAAVMATLVLATMLIGRVRSAPALLCTTGLVALLADPLLAARPGFALSVTATAGVVMLAPPFDRLLERGTPLPRAPRLLLAATLGAQIAVTPVLLGFGGLVHPASVPANLVAVPAAAVASMVGGLVAVLSTVAPGLAGGVAVLAGPPLAVVLWSARTFASPTGQQAAEWALVVVVVAVAAAGWRHLPALARRVVPAVGLAVAVGALGLPRGGPGLPAVPTLVVLDVGQGDALLLGDPLAGWILVDGGPDPDRLAAALAMMGIADLAAVVVSHPHADHTAGLVGLLQDAEVGALVIGPRGEEAAEVVAAARGSGLAPLLVAAGDAWQHGAMRITVLSPPPTGLGEEPNDNSLVLRVDVEGGRSALLSGDAEALSQGLLAGDADIATALDVDVLKVPHHGGDTNDPAFLAATSPEQALISVGADNGFGHPHPDVLADLAGIPLARTDLDGTITVPLAGL